MTIAASALNHRLNQLVYFCTHKPDKKTVLFLEWKSGTMNRWQHCRIAIRYRRSSCRHLWPLQNLNPVQLTTKLTYSDFNLNIDTNGDANDKLRHVKSRKKLAKSYILHQFKACYYISSHMYNIPWTLRAQRLLGCLTLNHWATAAFIILNVRSKVPVYICQHTN